VPVFGHPGTLDVSPNGTSQYRARRTRDDGPDSRPDGGSRYVFFTGLRRCWNKHQRSKYDTSKNVPLHRSLQCRFAQIPRER
jgi:hypothetical protein